MTGPRFYIGAGFQTPRRAEANPFWQHVGGSLHVKAAKIVEVASVGATFRELTFARQEPTYLPNHRVRASLRSFTD
jgi:hypothetical protein